MVLAAAQADFDENQGVAVGRDQIDFAAAHPVVAGDDVQALARQEIRGKGFRRRAGRAAANWIVLARPAPGPENAADE